MELEFVAFIVIVVVFVTESVHALHVAPTWDNSTHE